MIVRQVPWSNAEATALREAQRVEVEERYGTPVSTGILAALETYGRERGWLRLVLETGDAQPEAIHFYEHEGFTRIPYFGYYADSAHSVCFEKALCGADPAGDALCAGCQ